MGIQCRAGIHFRKPIVGCVLLARVWLGGALIFAAGCGNSEKRPDPGTQATVTGSTMLKDGKPLAVDSVVTFYCDAASATAGGKIDALGKFSLTAADARNGIPAGRYKVMVRPPEKAAAPVGSDDYKKMMMAGAQTAAPKTDGEIPVEFQSLDSTKLSLEVKSGANNFDIDLAKLNI